MDTTDDREDPSSGHNVRDETLEARYPFLRDDIFLVAQVNVRTGRQRLLLQQVDQTTGTILREESLDCIHVAVCDTSADEVDNEVPRLELEEASLHIRSSEKMTEINLSPEEKFIAFQSWVSGIAEAGMDAFHIQEEIDTAARLQVPIATTILRFLAGVDISYLFQYLEYVERAATYAGVRHDNFLIASLLPILEILNQLDKKTPEFSAVLDQVFALEPPLLIFLEKAEYIDFLHHPAAHALARKELEHLETGTISLSDRRRAQSLLCIGEVMLPSPVKGSERSQIETSLLKIAPPLNYFTEGQAFHFLLRNPLKNLLVEQELNRIGTFPVPLADPASELTPLLEILVHGDPDIPIAGSILKKIFALRPPLSIFLAREDFFYFLEYRSAREMIERDIAAIGWYPGLSPVLAATKLLEDITKGKKFKGRLLFPRDYSFLVDLETHLRAKFIPAGKLVEDTVEFTSKSGRVTRLVIFNHDRTLKLNLEEILYRLDHLAGLEELDLRGCQLHELPKSMEDLRKLRVLRIIENNLSDLPEFVRNWTMLEELNVAGNQIVRLPRGIKDLKLLRSLDLHANKLTLLPDEIGDLPSLTELVLSYNYLQALPSSIGNLRELVSLHLRNNLLEKLSDTIVHLASLKELILYGNNLSTLPPSLGKLEGLKTLNLGKNSFTTVPVAIQDLKSLALLIMADNPLNSVPDTLGALTRNAPSHIWVSEKIRTHQKDVII